MIKKTVTWHSGSTVFHSGVGMKALNEALKRQHHVMIVDETVLKLHGHRLPPIQAIPIVSSEVGKSLETVQNIYRQLTDMKADRNTLIWCVGGGVTTDIGAFSASTYMRGLPFILVPTTLLCQVDAAIGGKSGVNFMGFKNLVGNFAHPTDVVLDFDFLQTLPDEEVRNGIAEMIKHACISDIDYFEKFETFDELPQQLKSGQRAALSLIEKSISIKTEIVLQDEREEGTRKLLNFGHTFGHGVEALTKMPHGQAVAIGMVMSARLSEYLGLLRQTEVNRLLRLLSNFGLPVSLSIPIDEISEMLWHDKKKNANEIDMVVLTEIGKSKLLPLSIRQLKEFLHDLRKYQ